MKRWANKQWFRYRQMWLFLQPPLDILMKFLWGITTFVLTGWFVLTLDLAVFAFLVLNLFVWVGGFIGDKTGFWQDWGSRQVKITNTEVQEHLFNWQGHVIAKDILLGLSPVFDAIDTSFLDEAIEKEKKWFEIKAEEKEGK
jgi:hypothetical protein